MGATEDGKGYLFPGIGVTEGCDPPYSVKNQTLYPPEEQPVLLTAQPSLWAQQF